MYAAAAGHLAAVELLLEAGSDGRLRNHKRETALDLAEAGGHSDIVTTLARSKRGRLLGGVPRRSPPERRIRFSPNVHITT